MVELTEATVVRQATISPEASALVPKVAALSRLAKNRGGLTITVGALRNALERACFGVLSPYQPIAPPPIADAANRTTRVDAEFSDATG